MRILVITPFYAPDLGPSAALYEMLCEELVQLGHEVSVISAAPHYPTGRASEDFRGHLVQREHRRGVDVTRVWVPSVDRSKLSQRLLSFLCYQLLAAFAGIRRRYDVVIVSSPAFEVALPLLLLGFARRKRVIYSVHEIYPEVGTKLGIFRHRAVIRLVEWMEQFCCNRAASIRVISEGYKRALETKGIPSGKLSVIWDWVDPDFVRPLPRRNAFSTQWGLDQRLVVMYAGNIGPTQGLESVVEAAQLLASEPSIRFVFVGDGTSKAELEQSVRSKGLHNVLFIPFQPREMLPQVLATSDISLVALRKGLGADSVPSKLYSILASGRPVVAAADSDSDIASLIRESQCGMVTQPENPGALARAIRKLACDASLRDYFGENGRRFALNFCSKTQAAKRFQELLLSTSNPRKQTEERAPQDPASHRSQESVPCLICGMTDTETLFRGNGRRRIVRCRNDGLLFLNPRPTVEYLREVYGHFVRPDNLELFDSYRKSILRREAEVIKTLKPSGNLLDIGCATGTFFQNFHTTNWKLFGVDTASLGVEQARNKYGAYVFWGTLREANYPSEFFDVVTLLDTIYYAPDPKAELAEINRILKHDGVLAVEIPGLRYTLLREKGPICWLIDKKWSRGIADSLHLFHFSPETIRALLKQTGFRVIEMIPEQASLSKGRFHRLINNVHFRLGRLLFRGTGGKVSIAGKELYLARKASHSSSVSSIPPRHDAMDSSQEQFRELENNSIGLHARSRTAEF